MPRDPAGTYTYPPGIEGVPDQTIESADYNSFLSDVQADLNLPRPIVAGGSGASSADGALDNLSAEKFKQVVTNWDTTTWRAGSFYAATTATGTAPVASHAFAGIVYYANATDLVLEATDLTDPLNPVRYIRIQSAGVWGNWLLAAGSASGGGDYTFDINTTFPPPAGQVRFNNVTQNSATEIFISHLTALGIDNTASISIALKAGYDLFIQDKDEPAKYKLFTMTAAPVLSGGDFRVTATFKSGGTDIVNAQRVAISVTSAVAAIGTVKIQKFTASGTYTPSAGMVYCIIECLGGGGGAGGTIGTATSGQTAGGGGAGSYSRLVATAATIGASKAVTIGGGGAPINPGTVGVTGGDTSVGTLCIAKGGTGSAAGTTGGGGAPGGVAGTGDFTATGARGASAGGYVTAPDIVLLGGNGASSPFGTGGNGSFSYHSNVDGGNAAGYGSGGGGSSVHMSTSGAWGGGGSNGLVIITEYCTQ